MTYLLNTVNIAVQILPTTKTKNAFEIIDKAIEVIQNSGLKHEVCPFETVIEGNYDEIMEVIKEAQKVCYSAGADELIVNIKMHSKLNADVYIYEKTGKYKNR